MDVLLKVTYTQEFEVRRRDVESVKQAIAQFDPCEDLEGQIATYGHAFAESGVEIIDCPECGGKGYHYFENADGTGNSKNR